MINFIVGRPGSGKSLLTVKHIVDELRLTERYICTNVPLKLPDLAEYLHENYGQTFEMDRRIRMLEDSEVFDFWCHPMPGLDIKERTQIGEIQSKKDKQIVTRPDWSCISSKENPGYPGTLFVIDEVHEFFSARGWQNTGQDCLAYASQHRKFSHDVILVTQALSNVEAQLKSVAQDFTYCRNMANERFGVFKGMPRILQEKFLSPKSGQNKPMCSALVKIDVAGLCKCYDTAAGAGVTGRSGADVGIKRKGGIPLKVIVLVIALFIGAMVFVPHLIAHGVVGVAMTGVKGLGVQPGQAAIHAGASITGNTNLVPPTLQAQPAEPVQAVAASPKRQLPAVEADPVYLTGKVKINGNWHLYFSDGSKVVGPTSRILIVEAESVTLRDRFGGIEEFGFEPLHHAKSMAVKPSRYGTE